MKHPKPVSRDGSSVIGLCALPMHVCNMRNPATSGGIQEQARKGIAANRQQLGGGGTIRNMGGTVAGQCAMHKEGEDQIWVNDGFGQSVCGGHQSIVKERMRGREGQIILPQHCLIETWVLRTDGKSVERTAPKQIR